MKAALLHHHNEGLVIEDIDIPQLPSVCSPDTVLLKVQGVDKFAFVNVLNVAFAGSSDRMA